MKLVRKGGHLGVAYHVSGLLEGDIETSVPGRFSVYNSLTAVAICNHYGVDMEVMKKALLNAFCQRTYRTGACIR